MFIFAPPDAQLPEYATSASDLHIEILSSSQALSGMIDKIQFYLQNGVKRVWLVEPEKNRIQVCAPGRQVWRFESNDVLTDDLLPGFQLSLSELFSSIWSPRTCRVSKSFLQTGHSERREFAGDEEVETPLRARIHSGLQAELTTVLAECGRTTGVGEPPPSRRHRCAKEPASRSA